MRWADSTTTLQLVWDPGEIVGISRIGHSDIDLLANVEISIEIEVDLILLGETIVQVAEEEEHAGHIQDNKEGNLGLKSGEFFIQSPLDHGVPPPHGQGEDCAEE